ncbi:MAG: hypothetical protein LBR77_02905 [Lachnospiraceae bacterium]|jgi:uncharacterized Zn finger protein|nr:hypothetical protein [Lachnospiraceae bacterium]
MSWGYGYYQKPSAATIAKRIAKKRKQLEKTLGELQPITIEGRKLATTWWGKSWDENLERYADYENRIGRGRTYCRNGSILHLQISEGAVYALVAGTSLYEVHIRIDPLSDAKWKGICSACAKRVDSIAALVEGRFPKELADIFMKQGDGLFPTPKEIHMACDCPDWAGMCKHIAAALYGVGSRLDQDPLLFFTLRGVEPGELIKKSVEEKMQSLLAHANQTSDRIIDDPAQVEQIFGVL